MVRFAYVNGRFVNHDAAAVHVEDRGYQFADGVYEVVPVVDGLMVDEAGHLDRLERSLGELQIGMPMTRRVLELKSRELIARNRLHNGLLYMQVTRGVAPRNHSFPSPSTCQASYAPASVACCLPRQLGSRLTDLMSQRPQRMSGMVTTPTPSVNFAMLPKFMRFVVITIAGLTDGDGFVTEGTSSNAWIVTKNGALVTRPAGHETLNGITRLTLLRIAGEEGLSLEERPFSVEEALAAKEAFLTSATSFLTPVVRIDDQPIANGAPGSLSERLLAWYRDYAAGQRRDAAANKPAAAENEAA